MKKIHQKFLCLTFVLYGNGICQNIAYYSNDTAVLQDIMH